MSVHPNQRQEAPAQAGGFVEPQNLAQFNTLLVDYRVGTALTPSEFLLLKEQVQRVELARALIAIHGGGQNRQRATDFLKSRLKTARDLFQSGVRAAADKPPAAHGVPFVEPNTLAAVNDFLAGHRLDLSLTKPELDTLLRDTGRVALMTALKTIHNDGPERPVAEATLKAAIHSAKVLVARGESTPPGHSAASELPPESGGDAGYEGVPHSRGNGSRSNDRGTRSQSHQPSHGAAPSQRARVDEDNGYANHDDQHANSSQDNPRSDERDNRPQARAYGGRAALCIEALDSRQGHPTLRVEMAPANPDAQKAYVWTKKIVFDMMRKELLEFIAVLHGWAPGAHFKNHGPTKGKWLKIENQQNKLYMSMADKDVPLVGIPISEVDTLGDMLALAIRQASKTFHDIPPSDLLRFIQQRVAPYISPVEARHSNPR